MVSARTKLVLCLQLSVRLAVLVVICDSASRCQEAPIFQAPRTALAKGQSTGALSAKRQSTQLQDGSISGKVVDQSGSNIAGAVVKLTYEDRSAGVEVLSDDEGQFVFPNVTPGSFHLIVSSPGLALEDFSGTVTPGEAYVAPLFMLVIPTQVTEVHVGLTAEELSNIQIKDQEKQRVIGMIPNFYVSYTPNAAPLAPKLKFELAWKTAVDPVSLLGVGIVAGFDQAGDRWGAYGQGAQGYAKRYGVTYADVFSGTFIGGAILPSLLKQDPRYFYKGSGSKRSRILYALANSFVCKGDNGQWQPNYSNVIGSFAAGGIANLYYPANDRHGARSVVSSA